MVEIIVNYKERVVDNKMKLGWFDSKKDYLYFVLTSGDVLKLWKDGKAAAEWARAMEVAMTVKNAIKLYNNYKDILVCAYKECTDHPVRQFKKKELWEYLLFSKSDQIHRLIDILVSCPENSKSIMENIMIDDGLIHTYNVNVDDASFDSKTFEKEMRL